MPIGHAQQIMLQNRTFLIFMENNLQMNGKECLCEPMLLPSVRMMLSKDSITQTTSMLHAWLSHTFTHMSLNSLIVIMACLCMSACSTTQISSDIPSRGLDVQQRNAASTYNTNNNLLDSPDGSTHQGNLNIFGATY